MVNWYRRLNIDYKTVVWSAIITIVLILLMTPLFFLSWMEIPLGMALGSIIGIITYLLFGLFNNKDKPKTSIGITVGIMVLRFLLIGGILFLVGWLYYYKDIKVFNIFAVAGGYFIALVVSIFLLGKEKRSGLS